RIPRLGLDGERGGVALDDLDPILEACSFDTLPCGCRELGCALDAEDPAPERRREQDRRPALAAGEVEHARLRPEAQVLAEPQKLLGARRVLQLVVAFGDGVVPRHAGSLRGEGYLRGASEARAARA